jgi:hypothetical protein
MLQPLPDPALEMAVVFDVHRGNGKYARLHDEPQCVLWSDKIEIMI